jgi:hypothetical protein
MPRSGRSHATRSPRPGAWRPRTWPLCLAAAAAFVGPSLSAAPQRRPDLDAILSAAATYLAKYEREVTAVVAEEAYLQEIRFENRTRHLRSDLLVLQDAGLGWIGFRDVFEVDKRPVRDRDQRLVNLFLKPRRDAVDQAMRIVREGTRYNLSPRRVEFRRTINMPMTPLYFLRRQNQPRSTFALDPSTGHNGNGAVAVGFTERAEPRIVTTPDQAAARGAFWIQPESGRVVAALLLIDSRETRATIHVTFAEQPSLAMWLPVAMNEEYELGTHGTIVGRADYSNFRRFRVETTTEIEP